MGASSRGSGVSRESGNPGPSIFPGMMGLPFAADAAPTKASRPWALLR